MSYGLFAYGVVSGVAAIVAVLFLLLGLRRPTTRAIQLSIAFLAGAGSVSAVVHAQLQSTRDAEQYAAFIKGPFAAVGLLSLVALVWVIGAHTTVAYPAVPVVLSMATIGVAAINLAAPNGLLVDEVAGLREVSHFGDTFVLHEPSRSPWRIVLDAYLVAVAAYAVVAIVVLVLRRRREGRRAWPSTFTSAGLGVMVAFSLYDSLVDDALVGTPYLAPFGLLGLVIGLALAHAERVAVTERQLLIQSNELETIVADRTVALAAAHDQVVDQLEQQRQAAEHLARLTHEFVVLNSVALGHGRDPDFQRAVQSVIGCVGDVVAAREVHIELDGSVVSDPQPVAIHWAAEDEPEGATSGRGLSQRVLQLGDLRLGHLTMSWQGEPDLSDQQLQMLGLATDYLAAVLHRLDIQSSLVISAVDTERHRIARDLHDSVSQRLYAAAFNAEHLAASVVDDTAGAVEQATEIRALLLIAVTEMRALLFELQPKMLETTSLARLLISLCESLGAGRDRPIEVVARGGPPIPPAPKLAIYRIAQEALGNALRHAGATSIEVGLEADGDGVVLRVEDDGIGFEPEVVDRGYGLRNMAARAAQTGSELDVISNAGIGTTVWLRWPFGAEPDPAETAVGTCSPG